MTKESGLWRLQLKSYLRFRWMKISLAKRTNFNNTRQGPVKNSFVAHKLRSPGLCDLDVTRWKHLQMMFKFGRFSQRWWTASQSNMFVKAELRRWRCIRIQAKVPEIVNFIESFQVSMSPRQLFHFFGPIGNEALWPGQFPGTPALKTWCAI